MVPKIFLLTPLHGAQWLDCYKRSLESCILNIPRFAWGACRGSWLPANRDQCVRYFLESEADIALFVDSDQAWTWEQAVAICEAARVHGIAGGVYCYRHNRQPVLTLARPPGEPQRTEGALVEVHTIGAGFLAVSRSALMRMAARAPKYTAGSDPTVLQSFWAPCPPGWIESEDGLTMVRDTREVCQLEGEDSAFCRRARNVGLTVWAHTRVVVGHAAEPEPIYPASMDPENRAAVGLDAAQSAR